MPARSVSVRNLRRVTRRAAELGGQLRRTVPGEPSCGPNARLNDVGDELPRFGPGQFTIAAVDLTSRGMRDVRAGERVRVAPLERSEPLALVLTSRVVRCDRRRAGRLHAGVRPHHVLPLGGRSQVRLLDDIGAADARPCDRAGRLRVAGLAGHPRLELGLATEVDPQERRHRRQAGQALVVRGQPDRVARSTGRRRHRRCRGRRRSTPCCRSCGSPR